MGGILHSPSDPNFVSPSALPCENERRGITERVPRTDSHLPPAVLAVSCRFGSRVKSVAPHVLDRVWLGFSGEYPPSSPFFFCISCGTCNICNGAYVCAHGSGEYPTSFLCSPVSAAAFLVKLRMYMRGSEEPDAFFGCSTFRDSTVQIRCEFTHPNAYYITEAYPI